MRTEMQRKIYAKSLIVGAIGILIAVFVAFSPLWVSADMGPKPSVKVSIDVTDYDGIYFAFFVCNADQVMLRRTPSLQEIREKIAQSTSDGNIEEAEEWEVFRDYYETALPAAVRNVNETLAAQEGGWRVMSDLDAATNIAQLPVSPKDLYWTYYAPSEFRVVVVLEDGRYYLTQPTRRGAFESFYELEVNVTAQSADDLVMKFDAKGWRFAVQMAVRVILTIAVELLIAIPFIGFKRRRPYAIMAITNAVTNLVLNAIFICLDYFNGFQIINYMVPLWIAEVVVCAIEAAVYCFTIKDVPKWRLITYAIVANVSSYMLGIWVGAQLASLL